MLFQSHTSIALTPKLLHTFTFSGPFWNFSSLIVPLFLFFPSLIILWFSWMANDSPWRHLISFHDCSQVITFFFLLQKEQNWLRRETTNFITARANLSLVWYPAYRWVCVKYRVQYPLTFSPLYSCNIMKYELVLAQNSLCESLYMCLWKTMEEVGQADPLWGRTLWSQTTKG